MENFYKMKSLIKRKMNPYVIFILNILKEMKMILTEKQNNKKNKFFSNDILSSHSYSSRWQLSWLRKANMTENFPEKFSEFFQALDFIRKLAEWSPGRVKIGVKNIFCLIFHSLSLERASSHPKVCTFFFKFSAISFFNPFWSIVDGNYRSAAVPFVLFGTNSRFGDVTVKPRSMILELFKSWFIRSSLFVMQCINIRLLNIMVEQGLKAFTVMKIDFLVLL